MGSLLNALSSILKFLENVLTFPLRMLGLFDGLPARLATGFSWLPVGVSTVIAALIGAAIVFKIFGRE